MVAEATLMQQKYVSLIDVLLEISWLDLLQVNLWKNCKIPGGYEYIRLR